MGTWDSPGSFLPDAVDWACRSQSCGTGGRPSVVVTAQVEAHVLLAPGDARRRAAHAQGVGGAQESCDNDALHARDRGGKKEGDSAPRTVSNRPWNWKHYFRELEPDGRVVAEG